MNGESKEIIALIRGDLQSREHALKSLYIHKGLRSSIMKMLLNSGGKKEDFSLVLSESLIRFYKNCISEKSLMIEGSLTNYITGIARFCWYQMLKKKKINNPLESTFSLPLEQKNQEDLFFLKEKRVILKHIMGQLGKNCKEVLMFWSSGYSMKEIASKIGYKSSGMAKKKKHQCLKQMVTFIEENPEFKNELLD